MLTNYSLLTSLCSYTECVRKTWGEIWPESHWRLWTFCFGRLRRHKDVSDAESNFIKVHTIHQYTIYFFLVYTCIRGKGCAVVRALASNQCGPGSNPGVDAICGLSLLLVLSPAPKGFFRVLRFSPLLKNQQFQILIRSGTHGHV